MLVLSQKQLLEMAESIMPPHIAMNSNTVRHRAAGKQHDSISVHHYYAFDFKNK
jgi:hypothetical protein